MLGGIDPIIIFQLYKRIPDPTQLKAGMPLKSAPVKRVTFAVIPIYLSEQISGLYIDTESKNIDIDTKQTNGTDGTTSVSQTPIGSTTSVTLTGKIGSMGLTALLALSEQILDKLTSKEYEVTYVHNAITVFGGLVHSLSFEPVKGTDTYTIKIEFARGEVKDAKTEVGSKPDAARLSSTGVTPPSNAPTITSSTAGSGTSVIKPGAAVNVMRP